MHIADREGQTDDVYTFLEEGDSVDQKDASGDICLHLPRII